MSARSSSAPFGKLPSMPSLLRWMRWTARLALSSALLVPLLAFDCGAPAPAPDAGGPIPNVEAADVRSIEDLVDCLNEKLDAAQQANGSVSVADTVQCIPPCCSVTLTMSRSSAQAGCFMGGAGDPNPPSGVDPLDTQGQEPRCQLPRIILECPGPPLLMPSYTLCPVGSVSDGVQGSNRIEVGEVVDCDLNMRMGDIPVPPGSFDSQTDPIDDVVSQIPDSKSCNNCHGNPQDPVPAMGEELSDPFPLNPACIICTDNPDRTAVSGSCQSRTTTKECLSDICNCIDSAVNTDNHPLDNDQGRVVLALCRALEAYQTDRGVCGSEDCPPLIGDACTDIGEPCCGVTGETSAEATGYTCQEVGPDNAQCVPAQTCASYSQQGGGKFLLNGTVSMCRVEVSGQVATHDEETVNDSMGVTGSVSAFNYDTRTLVQSVSLETFVADLNGPDFSASGTGSALVNGLPASIEFETSETAGTVTCEIRDAGTSNVLAGGTGEAGRADYETTLTPVP